MFNRKIRFLYKFQIFIIILVVCCYIPVIKAYKCIMSEVGLVINKIHEEIKYDVVIFNRNQTP